jgi:hypothetical protein
MVQVVCHPRREQLTQRDAAERGMRARPLEVDLSQLQRDQLPEVLRLSSANVSSSWASA